MPDTLRDIDLTGYNTADLPRKRAWAAEIAAELRRLGFFAISGHGVPAATIDNALTAATAFFDLPVAETLWRLLDAGEEPTRAAIKHVGQRGTQNTLTDDGP